MELLIQVVEVGVLETIVHRLLLVKLEQLVVQV
jgi:hypothetical protein